MRRPKKRYSNFKLIRVFIKLIVILICLVLGWLLVSLGWSLKKSVWKQKGNLNLVVQSEKTYLMSYHPDDETLSIVVLPPNLYLDAALGYGEYQLENISKLGRIQVKNGGGFLTKSLQNYFHLPMDGYIIQVNSVPPDDSLVGIPTRPMPGGKKFIVKSEAIEKGNVLSLVFCVVTHKCETNLSSWDLLKIFNKFRQLKLTQVRVIDLLDQPNMVRQEKLPDGTQVLRLETLMLDDLGQKYFTDKLFISDHLKTILINATDYPQLAQKVSLLLTNSGLEVIVAKDEENLDQSIIEYANPDFARYDTFKKIKRYLNIEKSQLNTELEGDMEIILGEDFKKNFYQP